MKKILFYGMTGELMCFNHLLMNAIDMDESGHEVKIIFEGASVKLVPEYEKQENALYTKAKEKGLIAGACLGCSKALGVYEEVVDSGLELLDDMSGHAGMKKYVEDDYYVISM